MDPNYNMDSNTKAAETITSSNSIDKRSSAETSLPDAVPILATPQNTSQASKSQASNNQSIDQSAGNNNRPSFLEDSSINNSSKGNDNQSFKDFSLNNSGQNNNIRSSFLVDSSINQKQSNNTRSSSLEDSSVHTGGITRIPSDPFSLANQKRPSVEITSKSIKTTYPQGKTKKIKKYYNRQNALIDGYLGSNDEEAMEIEDQLKNGGKVKFAIRGSFTVNFFLFIIQMYAAVSTGSLALFGTAADAFMDLVSSTIMLITSRLAAKPNVKKFPVGRKRVETVGIILFCALMTTVAVELIIESARALGKGPSDSETLKLIPLIFVGVASKYFFVNEPMWWIKYWVFSKGCMFVYCFLLRRYPAAHIFMLDHRNDIAVNAFGLIMSIVGTRFKKVWFLDPTGAICIALLILFSWASTAFEHMWYLVGKSAPQDFLNKLVYMSITHDTRVLKIDTARAYHSGDKYYVEVDIVMARDERLEVTHDVAEGLQRKLEGLADVERAFVHVDYDGTHDIGEEHKPIYDISEAKEPLMRRVKDKLRFKGKVSEREVDARSPA